MNPHPMHTKFLLHTFEIHTHLKHTKQYTVVSMGMELIYIYTNVLNVQMPKLIVYLLSASPDQVHRGETNCFTGNSLCHKKEVSAFSSSRLVLVRTVLRMS